MNIIIRADEWYNRDLGDKEIVRIKENSPTELPWDNVDLVVRTFSEWGFDNFEFYFEDSRKRFEWSQKQGEMVDKPDIYYCVEDIIQMPETMHGLMPGSGGKWFLSAYKKFTGVFTGLKFDGVGVQEGTMIYTSERMENGREVVPIPIGRPQLFSGDDDPKKYLEVMIKSANFIPLKKFAESCLQEKVLDEMPNAFTWGLTCNLSPGLGRRGMGDIFDGNSFLNGHEGIFPIQFYKIEENSRRQ